MNSISYVKFDEVSPEEILEVLNNPRVRRHLVDHEVFTHESVVSWMDSKIKTDAIPGCRVRAVLNNNRVCGWCGIQLEDENYELAIVIDEKSWGLGRKIYNDLLDWAKALNHQVVYINLLHTRPQYRFLTRMAKSVQATEMLDARFTRYEIRLR